MADASDPTGSIYEGIWTDWSKSSKPWGWTWTLSPDKAVFVTNSVAVFVALAGGQLWSITRFTLHQAGAKSLAASPSTPNHKKEQVILRNAPTDLNTARLMACLAWKSRQRNGRIAPRTMAIALFALFHALLFMVAGTFSNLVISAGSPTGGSLVLLSRSKLCGTWDPAVQEIAGFGNNPENSTTLGMSVEWIAQREHNVQLSLEYAQKCYLDDSSHGNMSPLCNTLKKPKLDWTTMRNGSCPFPSHLCNRDSPVIVIDTGDINSHTDLGINAKPSERLLYRRITTCAVLNDTDYVEGWDGIINATSAGPLPNQKDELAKAFYGSNLIQKTEWTYSYANFAQHFSNFSASVTIPYQVDANIAWAPADPPYSVSDFEPIEEIAQDTADLTLFFLGYSGTYLEDIDDPWFAAHQPQSFPGSPPLLETRRARDRAISTMACTEQHRFCTSSGMCTEFGGFDQIQNNNTFNSTLTPYQNATFNRILLASSDGGIKTVVDGLRVTSTPLLAVNHMAVGNTVVSLPLSTTQWEQELNYWQSVAMAQLQRLVVQWGTGQVSPEADWLIPAEEEQDKWFCNNLLLPSTVYQSFSIMKIILIFIFGTLVIVVSLNIEAIARFCRKCFRKDDARPDWEHDDMLKLRGDMRESLWPPSLPSPQPPPPPPKSPRYQPERAAAPVRPKRSPEIQPTIRAVDNSPEVDSLEWKRSSSPTLPLEDRAVSMLSIPTERPDSRYLAEPGPIYRNDRDSWMAISLTDLDATSQAIPMRSLPADGAANRAPQSMQTSPMIQRLRNPIQFHLPRPQNSWV